MWVYLCVLIGLIIVFVVCTVFRFYGMTETEREEKIIKWLLWAVIEAEKDLGSKTGKLKLVKVYDMFIEKFPWAVKAISFDRFKEMVDEALKEMRMILNSNRTIAEYVNSDETDEATLKMNESIPKTSWAPERSKV